MSKYDYEQDFYGENDYSEMPSKSNNREKVADYMASMEIDKDDKLCFIKKMANTEATGPRMIKFLVFGSGQIGTTIRNAVTGEKYYGHRVGSSD